MILFHYPLQVCDIIANGGKRYWNDEQKVPYVVKDKQWIGYDDEASLKEKVFAFLC